MRSFVRICGFAIGLAAMACGQADVGEASSSESAALHGDDSPGNSGDHKTTICHATGSATNPYVIITVDDHALPAHRRHQDGRDIIPAPADGICIPPSPPPPCTDSCNCPPPTGNSCGSGGPTGGACGGSGGCTG